MEEGFNIISFSKSDEEQPELGRGRVLDCR